MKKAAIIVKYFRSLNMVKPMDAISLETIPETPTSLLETYQEAITEELRKRADPEWHAFKEKQQRHFEECLRLLDTAIEHLEAGIK